MKWSDASVASKLIITSGCTYHGGYKYNYSLPGNKTFREIKKKLLGHHGDHNYVLY